MWGVDETGDVIDWRELFGRQVDVFLDIGFGHGESTVTMAAADRTTGVVGIEVHTPGVATMLHAAAVAGLDNVRVVHGDTLIFLDRVGTGYACAAFASTSPIRGRRCGSTTGASSVHDVVGALTDRLQIGGTLHLATDIADYAAVMQRVCDAEPRLSGGVIERPSWRPLTRFERARPRRRPRRRSISSTAAPAELQRAQRAVDRAAQRTGSPAGEGSPEAQRPIDRLGGHLGRDREVTHLAPGPRLRACRRDGAWPVARRARPPRPVRRPPTRRRAD